MRLVVGLLFVVCSCGCLKAQTAPCSDVVIRDPAMPIYAPIARAANVEGVVRFAVTLSSDLKAEVRLLDGPKLLEGTAQKFMEDRQYRWATEGQHTACEYTATVEYRMIQSQSDVANDFYRVTILGIGHTLVETQPIKPSCMDCVNETCSLEGPIESKSPVYPPMARAAHVEGDVTARIMFDKDGKVVAVDQFTGPEMLKASAETYLRSWTVPKLPQSMDRCYASIFLSYQFQKPIESNPIETAFYKADNTHILIETHPTMIVDPSAEISRPKKHFLIF